MADVYMARTRELHMGGELGACIIALKSAIHIYLALGGPGSGCVCVLCAHVCVCVCVCVRMCRVLW